MRIFLASASSRRRLWLEAQPWVWPHDISVVPMNVDESRVMNISDVSGTVRDVVGLKIESARVLLRGDKDPFLSHKQFSTTCLFKSENFYIFDVMDGSIVFNFSIALSRRSERTGSVSFALALIKSSIDLALPIPSRAKHAL